MFLKIKFRAVIRVSGSIAKSDVTTSTKTVKTSPLDCLPRFRKACSYVHWGYVCTPLWRTMDGLN